MTRIDADWLRDPSVQRLCALLGDAGHQAWFVGGCVRNALLGVPVSDIDLTTDARPDAVLALAKAAGLRALPTGIEHGTVTVIVDHHPFEVTTLRRDVATDGRRATVTYADTITEDAQRRDFTMNALYADATGLVADPLGGLPDLAARRVHFIDDPTARIREDYLRILRYFRFHAHYGDPQAGVDPEAIAACAANLDGLDKLSAERVGQEMLKLLAAPDPAPALAAMAACGVLIRLLPGAGSDALAVLVHLEDLHGVIPDAIRRLAVIGGEDVAERLRLSKTNATRRERLRDTGTDHATFAYRHGAQDARDRLLVQAASFGHDVADGAFAAADLAAAQVFPLKAADLMPALKGAALGAALKAAERRWIASGFSLTKAQLLDGNS